MADVSISIIIPVYNVEQYLVRCLDSILNQTYRNWELILVNDGSTDNSGLICNQYVQSDSRIRVIHQPNEGVSAARNKGLDVATGDYISFIDPDDFIEAEMYSMLNDYLSEIKIDIVRFGAYRDGDVLNWLPFEGYYEGRRLDKEVVLPMIGSDHFGGMFILGVLWMHLFKRGLLETYNIRFDGRLRRCEDRLFTITTMIHADGILFLRDMFYHYMINDESLSNRYDPIRWQQEQLYLKCVKSVYTQNKDAAFVNLADKRLANDYVLRVITSINQEYFTNNKNSFWTRYRNIKQIVCSDQTRNALAVMTKKRLGWKGRIMLILIKKRLVFLLNIFNTIILLKNKL